MNAVPRVKGAVKIQIVTAKVEAKAKAEAEEIQNHRLPHLYFPT